MYAHSLSHYLLQMLRRPTLTTHYSLLTTHYSLQMLGLPMVAERAQLTYSTVAGGGDLSPRLPATACDARGDALWPAAVRITLLLDADLPEAEQARHTLYPYPYPYPNPYPYPYP